MKFNFSDEILNIDSKVKGMVAGAFAAAEEIKGTNQERMLRAFVENRVSTSHLTGTTGYGYDDIGRDTLDRVFADVVGAEAAIFRHSFASGTHAISVALFGLLRPGDTLLYATGRPYDTLHKVIGKKGDGTGSLLDFGILYEEIPMLAQGVDIEAIKKRCAKGGVKVVALQRSCGYADRVSLTIEQLGEIITQIKSINKDIIVFVDNCYGEFVQEREPTMVGADLMAGSLIKNAGGGIASTGGYIAGREDLVEQAAYRLTVPGIGSEIGSTGSALRELFLGLYFAPGVVCEAVKTAIYAGCMFSSIGMVTRPEYNAKRADILTSIDTEDAHKLSALCIAIQSASPVDSYVQPVSAPMPGYDDEVIMAAGAFTAGSSIELSCDGPMREPYTAFLQGGLNFAASRLAILNAVHKIQKV